jgi:Skp family chaperone for outer membrane proteins
MKSPILTLLALIFCFSVSLAQVQEAEKPMSTGVENSLNIVIPDAKKKDVEKLWKKYVKPYKGKTKKSRKTGEIFTDDATIPELSANTVDLYAKITEVGDEVMFSVWFDLGGGFLSSYSHPDRYSAGEKVMLFFALEVSGKVISDELKEDEKLLKKKEKELAKLKKENTKLHQSIENYKQKIKEAEAAIKQNEANQANKEAEIAQQREKVEATNRRLEAVKN